MTEITVTMLHRSARIAFYFYGMGITLPSVMCFSRKLALFQKRGDKLATVHYEFFVLYFSGPEIVYFFDPGDNAIFDDVEYSAISKELCLKIPGVDYPVSPDIYPFIFFEYLTACFNILNPVRSELVMALELFEIIFIYLFSRHYPDDLSCDNEIISDKFNEFLYLQDATFQITDAFREKFTQYLNRYKVFRDKNMMVKGWWRIDIDYNEIY